MAFVRGWGARKLCAPSFGICRPAPTAWIHPGMGPPAQMHPLAGPADRGCAAALHASGPHVTLHSHPILSSLVSLQHSYTHQEFK